MTYWIEVLFENGKTLRKESKSMNEIYSTLIRYDENRGRHRVQRIRTGRDDIVANTSNKMDKIVT